MAQRARVLLLKRADDELRRINSTELGAISPGPIKGADFLGEPKSIVTRETAARAKAETIRSLYGVRHTRSGTLFVQPLSLGDRIAIAGDFTGWATCPMKRNDQLGVYELCLPVPPGRRQYRLVVDGRWITDPFNEIAEPNPFGELNSIIDVDAPAAQAG
jgi:1,4-alpha-glucan branching enzyme